MYGSNAPSHHSCFLAYLNCDKYRFLVLTHKKTRPQGPGCQSHRDQFRGDMSSVYYDSGYGAGRKSADSATDSGFGTETPLSAAMLINPVSDKMLSKRNTRPPELAFSAT